jgi:hypothetical protein
MVVFHLPEGAGLLHCMLTDLATVPAVKSTYLFRGNLYQVTRPIETLDRHEDGSRLTTTEQLMELLAASAALNKKSPTLADLSKMLDIGDREPGAKDGKLIKVALELVKEADRVIMFETELLTRVGKTDGKALLTGLAQAAAATAATGDE